MIEIERTQDPVRLSVLRAILMDADIDCFVFDSGAGAILTGAIPSRLMVRDEDIELARRVIEQSGL